MQKHGNGQSYFVRWISQTYFKDFRASHDWSHGRTCRSPIQTIPSSQLIGIIISHNKRPCQGHFKAIKLQKYISEHFMIFMSTRICLMKKKHRWLLGDTASIVVGYKLSIVWGNHPVNLGRSRACLRVKWFEVTIQYQMGGVHFNQLVNHHINLISCFIYLSFCRQASALRTWGTALSPLHGHLLFDWENRLPKGLSFTCQVFPKNEKCYIWIWVKTGFPHNSMTNKHILHYYNLWCNRA